MDQKIHIERELEDNVLIMFFLDLEISLAKTCKRPLHSLKDRLQMDLQSDKELIGLSLAPQGAKILAIVYSSGTVTPCQCANTCIYITSERLGFD